ncbi:contractile injection system protein, VgrG/Pvc8 family [Reinekea sp.]|uniref:contractile injection system protein, VgrG/Pvc8 family n=1 Tax=Reinekea sp. TaxID=1970455 RepID=UPI0039892D29
MNLNSVLQCQFGGRTFFVKRYAGYEKLSTPFQFEITLDRADFLFVASELMGQSATLVFTNALGDHRYVTGQITHSTYDLNDCTLTLKPILALGAHYSNTRLFLGKSRREIIDQLLQELGYGADQIHWLGNSSETELEPSVLQAQEAQLSFFQRLLAELNCFFWFASDGHDEQIYIANSLVETQFLANIIGDEQQRKAVMNGVDSPLIAQWDHNETNDDDVKETWQLSGCWPTLAVGYSLTVPLEWRENRDNDALTVTTLQHRGEAYEGRSPQLGLQLNVSALLIRRRSNYTPTKPELPSFPSIFPATIESNFDYAQIDEQGRYQLRMEFSHNNTEQLAHGMASPAIERMVPFAQANTALPTGWHFPLIDQSRVLVSLLNNDPNRLCVLGFAPQQTQQGPVTQKNSSQYRIVTPAKNELCFDDALPSVLLQSLDGQVSFEMNAEEAQHYISLASQYGMIKLSSKALQQWVAQTNYNQQSAGDHHLKAEHAIHFESESTQQWQAENVGALQARKDIGQSAKGEISVKTNQGKIHIQSEQTSTVSSQASQVVKINQGSYGIQASNDIQIKGTGQGDITLTNGTGGFKIDGQGNIKLFGSQITIDGSSGSVNFSGDVAYDIGGENQPESLNEVDLSTLDDLEPLVSDKTPAIRHISWQKEFIKLSQAVDIRISVQGFDDNSVIQLEIEQINPDGTFQKLEVVEQSIELGFGINNILWRAPKALSETQSYTEHDNISPYYLRVRAVRDNIISNWSEYLQINMDVKVQLNTDTGEQLNDGSVAWLNSADGEHHQTVIQDGQANFINVASGPYRLSLEKHLHK